MHLATVEVALAAAPAEVRPGDTLRLTATMRNPTPDTLRMEFAGACPVAFYVRSDSSSAVVEPPDGVAKCDGPARTLTLAPGASERFTHAWTPADGATPGAYTAYAVTGEHHLVRGREREYRVGRRSNEVPVRVQPR
jgi:hypothetical protein